MSLIYSPAQYNLDNSFSTESMNKLSLLVGPNYIEVTRRIGGVTLDAICYGDREWSLKRGKGCGLPDLNLGLCDLPVSV